MIRKGPSGVSAVTERLLYRQTVTQCKEQVTKGERSA
jgi:hypothetical protein